jgi:hypothetical protein
MIATDHAAYFLSRRQKRCSAARSIARNPAALHCSRNDTLEIFDADANMPKSLTEIRSISRSHTRSAINVLVGIMRSKDATAAARVTAANAILDRGWGKAAQAIHTGDGGLELIHKIERVIVRPENVDPENSDSQDL